MSDDSTRKIMIASFQTPDGAAASLQSLKAEGVGLGNVAVITRDHAGNVDFTESQDWGVGKSALVGAIAGLLLPGVGTIALAAGGALAAYFIDLGFPDQLLKQMGDGLNANSSILVALVEEGAYERATAVIEQAHGRVEAISHETDLAKALASVHPK